VATINTRLDTVGYAGPRISTGIYPNPVDTTNILAKLDHQVSGRDQLSIRYGRYNASATNSRGAGGFGSTCPFASRARIEAKSNRKPSM
jgi:hypothetical protein